MIDKPPITGIHVGVDQGTLDFFNDPGLYGYIDYCRLLLSLTTIKEVGSLTAYFTKTLLDVPFCQVYALHNGRLELADGFPTAAQTNGDFVKFLNASLTSPEFQIASLQNQPYVIDTEKNQKSLRSINLHFQDVNRIVLVSLAIDEKLLGLLVYGENSQLRKPKLPNQRLGYAEVIALQTATAINKILMTQQIDSDQLQTVLALAKTVEMRDSHLSGHCEKIAGLSEQVAKRLGCTKKEIRTIRWSALLHDIGKIGIPDSILQKPGPLTKEEWEEIRRHSEIGAEIVIKASNLKDVAELVKDHHEKFDGSGYPEGKKGSGIPIGARILAVADAFSAITDGRVYHSAKSQEAAIEEIRSCAGKDFDPEVVSEFIRLFTRSNAGGAQNQAGL